MTLCVETILDHPTVDAIHVHPSRDNTSSDRPINFQAQQRLFTHTYSRTRQTSCFPGTSPRQGLFLSHRCHVLGLTHDPHCYSSSRTTPQRRSPCRISNSRSCQKHIHPSIASRHWITCTYATLRPEWLCLTLSLSKVKLVVRTYC